MARKDDLERAVKYASIRWGIHLTELDAESLFKAVKDDELRALIPLIIDQHFDDHGFEDPVDFLDSEAVRDMEKQIKELGFDHSPL